MVIFTSFQGIYPSQIASRLSATIVSLRWEAGIRNVQNLMTRTNGNQPETITDLLLRTVAYEYDDRNNPEKITDALNRVTEAEYTEFDLPSTVTDALLNSVSFAYNPGRSLSEITDARGKSYSMDYDMHGLRETLGQLDGATTTWERNLGALLTEWTPRGSSGSAEYDYDSRNRVTSRSWTRNSLTATSSYTYNDA